MQAKTNNTKSQDVINFGFLIFPNIQQLDFTAPYEVISSVPMVSNDVNINIKLISKNLEPVLSVTGLSFTPTFNYENCGHLDVLCIPGGKGVNALMENQNTISFIQKVAPNLRYLTSICTGSMVLGAAGLLKGKKATSHWGCIDLLASFGAIASKNRIQRDGNIITAGGVTSGIDFGLTIVAELYGEAIAKKIQLQLQYDPQPPFNCGTPENASKDILNDVLELNKNTHQQREDIIRRLNKNK